MKSRTIDSELLRNKRSDSFILLHSEVGVQ